MFVALFVSVLWHINLCRLFNAKSIFIQITVLIQTIQFSISTLFNCQKHFYFKPYSSITGISPSECLVSYPGHS